MNPFLLSNPIHANKSKRGALAKKAVPKHQAAYRKAAFAFPLQFSLHFFTFSSKSLWLLLCLVAVAACAVWLLQMQHWLLRQVDIEAIDANGQRTHLQHLALSDVQQTLKPLAQGSLLWLDLTAIQKALLQLAWVQAAQVQRRWPDGLLVQLREQQAVAYWQTLHAAENPEQAAQALLNPQAEVFLTAPQPIPATLALPHLHGIAGSQVQVLKNYQTLLTPLQATDLSIQSVQFDAHQHWRVWLSRDNQQANAWFSVSLGKMPVIERWQQFIRFYQSHLRKQTQTIHSVDLRYEHGMAVAY